VCTYAVANLWSEEETDSKILVAHVNLGMIC
jgi:hypothetical protein